MKVGRVSLLCYLLFNVEMDKTRLKKPKG